MIDEKRVAHLMKTLELTREEALEMLAEDDAIDHGANPNPLTPEQEKVAKAMRQADRKPTVYKFPKKERKPNENKRFLIQCFENLLQTLDDVTNVNTSNKERQIDFSFGGEEFSITLTQHRKKK